MAKSFAEDGAQGAYSGSASGFDAMKAAESTPATPTPTQMPTSTPSAANYAAQAGQSGYQGYWGGAAGSTSAPASPDTGGDKPYGSGGDMMNYTGYTTPGNATYKQASISRDPTVYQDTTGMTNWGRQFLTGQNDTRATGWAEGGAIPDDSDGGSAPDSAPSDGGGDSDGSPGQSDMAQALNSVDQVMQYLYQKHGLSDGGGQSDPYAARPDKAQDISDRTNEWSSKILPQSAVGAIRDNVVTPVSNFAGKVSNLYDRATGQRVYQDTSKFSNNPMSQELGINDMANPKNRTLEGLGDTGESANNETDETGGPANMEEQ